MPARPPTGILCPRLSKQSCFKGEVERRPIRHCGTRAAPTPGTHTWQLEPLLCLHSGKRLEPGAHMSRPGRTRETGFAPVPQIHTEHTPAPTAAGYLAHSPDHWAWGSGCCVWLQGHRDPGRTAQNACRVQAEALAHSLGAAGASAARELHLAPRLPLRPPRFSQGKECVTQVPARPRGREGGGGRSRPPG